MDIEEILDDIRNEPPWRHEANREMSYRDCNQLPSDVLQAMEADGMLPVTKPLIGAIMDSVIGVEAMTRRDGVVLANEDQDGDLALALSKRLKEVEARSGADVAISQAYESKVCVGIGWVEVGRNPNPFRYPHKCTAPHRRELWWDWRAGTDQDMWRYVVRRKRYDQDVLAAMFPQSRDVIDRAAKGLPAWAATNTVIGSHRDDAEELYRSGRLEDLGHERGIADWEWRDTERTRLDLFEVWYRAYGAGEVLRVPQFDLVVEFEPENPRHLALLDAGVAEIEAAVIPRMRLAWWIGPHKIADIASPYPHEEFPYVPFLGFAEDATGVYYGLIRRMMSGQDQINAASTKLHHLMSSTFVMGDSDAFLDSLEDLEARVGKKNAIVLLNPRRAHPERLPQLVTDRQLAAQHFQVLQESQQTLGPNAGVHNAYQGKSTDSQSGVALNTLVEQASTGLATLNRGYPGERKKVLEILLANELERMSGREFCVMIERNRAKTPVYFNQRAQHPETGDEVLSNDLSRLMTRVELADAPATATFRQARQAQLMSLAETLPDMLKATLIPMLVRGSDAPDREEVAQQLERAMGQGADQAQASPADQLNAQRMAALQQQAQQLDLEEKQARIRGEQAKADKLEAEVERLRAEVESLIRATQQQAANQAMATAVAQGQMQNLAAVNALPAGAAP